jgi:uncharacterized protein (DUF1499 family)
MRFVEPQAAPAASRWTSRIAIFSLVLLLTALLLHRLFGLDTLIALNLVKAAYAGVGLSLLLAVAAVAVIWHHGTQGTARVVFAVTVCLAMLAGPLALALLARDYPMINDITTDTVSPPPFDIVGKMRGPGTNQVTYPGEAFALQQRHAYPDLKPLLVDRSAQEAFELVVDAVRRLKMDIVREEAPGGVAGKTGYIEAVDRTLVLGFYDDVAIRVSGGEAMSRIDIRSASRFGWSDLGANAERVRALMHEIVARLEATVPTAEDDRSQLDKKARDKLKQEKDDDRKSRKSRRRDR